MAGTAIHQATVEPRITRLLARRGLGDGDHEGSALDAWAEDAPVLAGLAAASVQGTVALGPHRGARLRRLGDPPESIEVPAPDGCHARANGFDLHAGLVVPAGQRERLERVCRYALRPPVAGDRVCVTSRFALGSIDAESRRSAPITAINPPFAVTTDDVGSCTSEAQH